MPFVVSKKAGYNILPVVVCITGIGMLGMVAGCEKKAGTAVASSGAKPGAPVSATDNDRVQKFLTELEAQPADKRNSFVNSHQNEAAMASQSTDPQISQKFYNLMMPKMVGPQK